ncbi:MAG TPA: methyltransferase domain-containing protein [Dactylosporangium sp.]|jgi:SAM-dependent methyltransferase|nr:methyltransferase domain-containing protein [Dactylosporangium sp.]
MDILTMHEISEAGHRILNPFTEEKLMLLGEICRLRPGQRQLDLCCGKGEMLCRWADAFGIEGRGVDISEAFLPVARARAVELGVADRVTFDLAEAAAAVKAEHMQYHIVSCIGATWIGGGLAGTADLMRPALVDGGLLLIGEPWWAEDTPDEAYAGVGMERDDYTTLEGTLDRIEGAGLELLEMVTADGDSWDRYVASQWWAVSDWLRENAGSPDAPAMRQYLETCRRGYMRYQRRYMGWGIFVCRVTER